MFAKADNKQEYQRLIREGLDGLTAPRVVAEFDRNVDKVGEDATDSLFAAKRAITGRKHAADEQP
jgi:hypothetical protein